MHLYELKNTRAAGSSAYIIFDAYGTSRRILPGTAAEVPLSDANAISLKRTENRGGLLKIKPVSEEGEEVLHAIQPKQRKGLPPPQPRKSLARIEREAERALAEERAKAAAAHGATKRELPAKVVLPGRRVGDRNAAVLRDMGIAEAADDAPTARVEAGKKRAVTDSAAQPEGRPRVRKGKKIPSEAA